MASVVSGLPSAVPRLEATSTGPTMTSIPSTATISALVSIMAATTRSSFAACQPDDNGYAAQLASTDQLEDGQVEGGVLGVSDDDSSAGSCEDLGHGRTCVVWTIPTAGPAAMTERSGRGTMEFPARREPHDMPRQPCA